jgi:hypothetical protein
LNISRFRKGNVRLPDQSSLAACAQPAHSCFANDSATSYLCPRGNH